MMELPSTGDKAESPRQESGEPIGYYLQLLEFSGGASDRIRWSDFRRAMVPVLYQERTSCVIDQSGEHGGGSSGESTACVPGPHLCCSSKLQEESSPTVDVITDPTQELPTKAAAAKKEPPQNHDKDGLLGPNSIVVVYMDPVGSV